MSNLDGGPPLNGPGNPKPEPPQRPNVNEQWNSLMQDERVQKARQTSKQYSGYFLNALKAPYATMKSVSPAHSLNGWITMVLIAVLSSFYFLTWFLKWDISPAFGPGFLKPLLLTALSLAVAFGLTYAVLRMEKVNPDLRLLAAQFGTLLVPAVAVLALAVLFLMFSLYSFSTYLLMLAFLFIFVAINSVIFQYPIRALSGRIDTTYLIVTGNAATGYLLFKLVASVISGAVGGIFSGF
ncbi:hypothetical protein [Paenibacillus donghaensis]|uniref:Yip1 domain-containing protein n=1 Tax=Paenibacillus donghaensis TaxID=414771 RepID=A0A2Z2KNB0_9BACL|nr:hypothetical protein [Paenibacillus donghaensis]ASA25945.1 hypothetical protein B9T62_37680 [Paenibacillus donghaensis]